MFENKEVKLKPGTILLQLEKESCNINTLISFPKSELTKMEIKKQKVSAQ